MYIHTVYLECVSYREEWMSDDTASIYLKFANFSNHNLLVISEQMRLKRQNHWVFWIEQWCILLLTSVSFVRGRLCSFVFPKVHWVALKYFIKGPYWTEALQRWVCVYTCILFLSSKVLIHSPPPVPSSLTLFTFSPTHHLVVLQPQLPLNLRRSLTKRTAIKAPGSAHYPLLPGPAHLGWQTAGSRSSRRGHPWKIWLEEVKFNIKQSGRGWSHRRAGREKETRPNAAAAQQPDIAAGMYWSLLIGRGVRKYNKHNMSYAMWNQLIKAVTTELDDRRGRAAEYKQLRVLMCKSKVTRSERHRWDQEDTES